VPAQESGFDHERQEVGMLFKKTETVELRVEGMTCGHCERAVKQALEALPGVKGATVSAAEGKATVKVEPGKADVAAMRKAVEEAGYRVKA
jgi:copper chaperone